MKRADVQHSNLPAPDLALRNGMTAATVENLRRWAIGATLVLLPIHLWMAARLELSFDEAYYVLWSRNLAWGYLDHPPMVALWIRLSTTLFGSGEFGIRALASLAVAAGAALIYLMTWELMRDRATALLAVLFYTASVLIQVGALVVTPDTPLVFFWSIALFGLAKIYRSGNAWWWLVVGIASGCALSSKYSAAFLGAGIAAALVVVPSMRRWLLHPAPYVCGALAVAIFAPVVVWNADHGWASFSKQLGRAAANEFTWRYVAEFAGAQAGLLGPFCLVLGLVGLWRAVRGTGGPHDEARRLLAATVLPMLLYFAFHTLHARVQGNWPAPLYAAFAILAADTARRALDDTTGSWWPRSLAWASRAALPVGLVATAIVYLQALAAPFPLAPMADPTAQMTGWRRLGEDLGRVIEREKSAFVLTSGYALTSELTVYGPKDTPVVQYNERLRWDAFAQPDAGLFQKRGLYVADAGNDKSPELRVRFATVTPLVALRRSRNGLTSGCYFVYALDTPIAPILGDGASAGHSDRLFQESRQLRKDHQAAQATGNACAGKGFAPVLP